MSTIKPPTGNIETALGQHHKLWFGSDTDAHDIEVSLAIQQLHVFIEEELSLPAYTITKNIGCWASSKELGFTLEVIDTDTPTPTSKFRKLAEWYKYRFNQDAVLYTCTPVYYKML